MAYCQNQDVFDLVGLYGLYGLFGLFGVFGLSGLFGLFGVFGLFGLHCDDSFYCNAVDIHVFSFVNGNDLYDIAQYLINNSDAFLVGVEFNVPPQVVSLPYSQGHRHKPGSFPV